MQAHLVLIDALNLIRRIYAVQARPFSYNGELAPNTVDQVIHNTEQACSQAVQKILHNLNATHALAVFDASQPCWRYQLYPDYKKGRAPMPAPLSAKLNQIKDSFMQLGVDSLDPEQDEADDLIATLAIKVALHNQYTTIVSTDKGFLSLLRPNIAVFDYFNRRFLDAAYVKEKFKVTPNQLVDLWSLTGDNTNKIPGVPGIGLVTAAELINQYSNLHHLLKADTVKAKYQALLAEHKDNLLLAKQLLTLKQDIPLGFNLKDIRLATNEPEQSSATVAQASNVHPIQRN